MHPLGGSRSARLVATTRQFLIYKFNNKAIRVCLPLYAINENMARDNSRTAVITLDEWFDLLKEALTANERLRNGWHGRYRHLWRSVTGTTRDRDLDRLEQMVRGRYIDPLEQQAKDMVKSQVAKALSGMEGVTGAAISQVVALADSQDPNDKLVFNQIVSRLNLPVKYPAYGRRLHGFKAF